MATRTGTVTCQSSGTVSIRVGVSGAPSTYLFFIPDCNHYVKFKEQNYAAFVAKDDDKVALLHKYEKDGIQIELDSTSHLLPSILATACANQNKVTIEVEIEISVDSTASGIKKLYPTKIKVLTAIESPAK